MASNAHNSLIVTTPTNCTGNRWGSLFFDFNSFTSICRKLAADRGTIIKLFLILKQYETII